MVILDTNVLSELTRREPDPNVVAWLDRQSPSSIWITSVTLMEIRFGLQILPAGRRRRLLTKMYDEVLVDEIGMRIAPFDHLAAQHAAGLMASRHKRGHPVDLRDTMIAGIVLSRNATLATRNTPHFEDVIRSVINPWKI